MRSKYGDSVSTVDKQTYIWLYIQIIIERMLNYHLHKMKLIKR